MKKLIVNNKHKEKGIIEKIQNLMSNEKYVKCIKFVK
jgi:hypothetical protein